jgi:hypothetical protein
MTRSPPVPDRVWTPPTRFSARGTESSPYANLRARSTNVGSPAFQTQRCETKKVAVAAYTTPARRDATYNARVLVVKVRCHQDFLGLTHTRKHGRLSFIVAISANTDIHFLRKVVCAVSVGETDDWIRRAHGKVLPGTCTHQSHRRTLCCRRSGSAEGRTHYLVKHGRCDRIRRRRMQLQREGRKSKGLHGWIWIGALHRARSRKEPGSGSS